LRAARSITRIRPEIAAMLSLEPSGPPQVRARLRLVP
jgi:hypothetical protein